MADSMVNVTIEKSRLAFTSGLVNFHGSPSEMRL